jgi:hypothetical protein
MRDYAAEMHRHSFHVLSYFNLNEFGADVRVPCPAVPDAGSWKDQHAWLCDVFPGAVLRPPTGEKSDWPDIHSQPAHEGLPPVYWSWEACVAVDPGDPAFADFLMEQAARHIAKIPEASGICIDRLDWLRLFNHGADDGIAWLGGRPVRSLHTSHRQIMERLGGLLHDAGKVIFVNNHVKRIEQMRHADGIIDEFTYGGCALNTSALLCLRKPALGWTASEEQIHAGPPDHYYQRHLYMGVYPMAPFPGNDHSLEPSPFADRIACDYGPLFNLLRGKKWVLLPDLVSLDDPTAKWNLFETRQGLLLIIAFAEKTAVRVKINDAGRIGLGTASAATVYHPADGLLPQPAEIISINKDLEIHAPLNRGCAALLFPPAAGMISQTTKFS